jgi:hypothetical protein
VAWCLIKHSGRFTLPLPASLVFYISCFHSPYLFFSPSSSVVSLFSFLISFFRPGFLPRVMWQVKRWTWILPEPVSRLLSDPQPLVSEHEMRRFWRARLRVNKWVTCKASLASAADKQVAGGARYVGAHPFSSPLGTGGCAGGIWVAIVVVVLALVFVVEGLCLNLVMRLASVSGCTPASAWTSLVHISARGQVCSMRSSSRSGNSVTLPLEWYSVRILGGLTEIVIGICRYFP